MTFPYTALTPIVTYPVALTLRALIDEAVHSSISRAYEGRRQDGFGSCADYAVVGARVLSLLTKKPYRYVAGGEIVDCGNGVVAVLTTSRQNRRSVKHLSQLSRYHCWIECKHIVNSESRTELVDFAVRHDPQIAQTLGLPYDRPEREPFLWCWRDELAQDLSRSPLKDHPFVLAQRLTCPMWPQAELTRLLRECEQERPHYFAGLTSTVLTALADRIETAMKLTQ